MQTKKVVIIGSGIGGSAIGALLAAEGRFQITLVEKSNLIGGRFAGFEKDGFQLDVGCHMLANCEKGALGKVLDLCGSSDYVQWRYARGPSPVINYKGERVKFPFEMQKMGFTPQDMGDFLKFHNAISAMSPEECDRNMNVSIREYVSRFVKNELARNVVGFFGAIYFVAPDDQVPIGEYARCQNEISINKTLGYPVGGTAAVPQAYCRIIRENGGQVLTGKGVDRILVNNGRATGVRLDDGAVLDADMVISNASIKDTVLNLVGAGAYPEAFVKQIKSYRYSMNTHAIKIALDKRITDETMVFYIGQDYSSSDEKKRADAPLPEEAPYLMIPVVSNIDPEAAPEGKQLIIAGGGSGRPVTSPKETWEKWDRAVMASVKKVFPGIEEHILWTVTHSAASIDAMFGEDGNVIGVAQVIGQVGADRPPMIDPQVSNLYHCSADTGLHGIGGELAADAALRLFSYLA